MTTAQASAQPLVINTRPDERAAPLTEYLVDSGFDVVEMPMLALAPCAVSAADIQNMHRWLEGDYQALVVISPTAAASGLSMWQQMTADRVGADAATEGTVPVTSMIAVGSATAAALSSCHTEIKAPQVSNNEGLLAMPEIAALQAGDRVLIWRGLGGRRLLVDALTARGVQVDSIAWYERVLPPMAHTHYQNWQQKLACQYSSIDHPPKPIVIISSGTAFEHWVSVVTHAVAAFTDTPPSHGQSAMMTLSDFVYVVLGARLEKMVAEHQLSYWRVENLAPDTIVNAIRGNPEPASTLNNSQP